METGMGTPSGQPGSSNHGKVNFFASHYTLKYNWSQGIGYGKMQPRKAGRFMLSLRKYSDVNQDIE